jgi:hypothetical protein
MSVWRLQPLHQRFSNVEGPISAYRSAEPWTPELQQKLEEAFERDQEEAHSISSLVSCIIYRCPKCERPQEEIHFESLVFYADGDFHRLRPEGEARLITMTTCGHRFGREITT